MISVCCFRVEINILVGCAKALIYYSREDALLVLTGGMSEEDYIMRHICSTTDADGNVLTHEDGGLDDFAVEDIF